MTIALADLTGRACPYRVRYVGDGSKKPKAPITVVGYQDSDLGLIARAPAEHTNVVFEGGGWLWLPDLLRHYELVD